MKFVFSIDLTVLNKSFFLYRWEKTSQELQQKSNKFDESFEDWEKYEQEYSQARNWLTAKELSSRELLSHCGGNKEECLRICKVILF